MATDKQHRAVIIYMENRGKSLSGAMREAGYSNATAKNPKTLRESKAWKDMIDEQLDDAELLAKHRELLNANVLDHMVFPLNVELTEISELLKSTGCVPQKVKPSPNGIHVWFWAPDHGTRGRALELAYKLKGKLTNKVELTDPDGLFGSDALTIHIVDGSTDNPQPEATAGA